MPLKPHAPPIEVDAGRVQPLGMPPARFLRDYWQQHPLLVRGAFAGLETPLQPEDLAGLACEELALSRLVLHEPKRDRWTLRNGPFGEDDFAALPKSHWTLLVQDVDKWDIDVAALLAPFDFLPSWRVDDIMVSYAVDGGSVGAHVDQYDVFLIQGMGRRRWRISTDPQAPLAFRDDAELKLLRAFTPTHDWLLEPGDMLYLPPGIAHHGIADGACLTFSVGMRAPAVAEMLADFAAHVAERLPDTSRYSDAGLAPVRAAGEIDEAALEKIARLLRDSMSLDASTLRDWFPAFITRYRAAHDVLPRPRALSVAQFDKELRAGVALMPNPWSRFAWSADGERARLYVTGDAHACPRALAIRLCERTPIGATEAVDFDMPERELLRELVNSGHLALVRPGRKR